MKRLKIIIILVSVLVFAICLYSFLLGNKVFQGTFENEFAAWYFLAKGIFCSFALYMLVLILESVSNKKC